MLKVIKVQWTHRGDGTWESPERELQRKLNEEDVVEVLSVTPIVRDANAPGDELNDVELIVIARTEAGK